MKSIAILQSNYIPWKGYFDIMRSVDEFVILDSVQYTKNDWRNRNRIRTPRGPAWLTIPVRTANRFSQRIADAEVAESDWARRHWQTILQNYRHFPRFREYSDSLEDAYENAAPEQKLSRINRLFLARICQWLHISTNVTSSALYPDHPDRIERLIGICRAAGANRYLSGPRACAYLDTARFHAAGIEVEIFDYGTAPEPRLSIIDGVLTS